MARAQIIPLMLSCAALACSSSIPASEAECSAAAANLRENGGMLGESLAVEIMQKTGPKSCLASFSSSQAACLAELTEVSKDSVLACE
jgi:hypothetical protein